MTRTGRPKSPERLVRRTVRNRPIVDTALLRIALEQGKDVGAVMREACERFVGEVVEA